MSDDKSRAKRSYTIHMTVGVTGSATFALKVEAASKKEALRIAKKTDEENYEEIDEDLEYDFGQYDYPDYEVVSGGEDEDDEDEDEDDDDDDDDEDEDEDDDGDGGDEEDADEILRQWLTMKGLN